MKLLVIIALPVIVAAFLIERLLGSRRIKHHGSTRVGIGAEDALCKLLKTDETLLTQVVVKRMSVKGPIRDGQIVLSRGEAESGSSAALGRAVWLAGLSKIESTSPHILKWWRSARTFGSVGVPLIWMILIFALFGTSMTSGMFIGWSLFVLALSCALLLMQLPMNLQAVKYGKAMLDKARLLHRMDDEAAVESCATAQAFLEVLPRCLTIFPRKKHSLPKK